jgi:hypothetical protein
VSTAFLPFPPFISYYDVHFFAAVNTMVPCNTVSAVCLGPENGGLQNVLTLDWIDNSGDIVSTDTVSIQSGIPTPEPAALPWLLAASATLGIAIRRASIK